MRNRILAVFLWGVGGCIITSFQQNSVLPKSTMIKVSIIFTNKVKNYKMAYNDSVYTNSSGEAYTISKFKYYVSQFSFLRSNGQNTTDDNFYLIDEADEVSKIFSILVPEGEYTGIRFLLGVDSLYNVSGAQSGALDPAKDMFWTWNTGYVMAKLEGISRSSTLVNHKYQYHIGGFSGKNNVLQSIQLKLPQEEDLLLSTNKEFKIYIDADVDAWWQNPHVISIAANANITSPGKLAVQMSENYANMFRITKMIAE